VLHSTLERLTASTGAAFVRHLSRSRRRSERASAAIARLRRQGKTEHLGRPRKPVDRATARRLHAQGIALRAIAAELGVSAMTVQRIVTAA
jgi:DNA invertase Pin-like site-specific DNA recombinase